LKGMNYNKDSIESLLSAFHNISTIIGREKYNL